METSKTQTSKTEVFKGKLDHVTQTNLKLPDKSFLAFYIPGKNFAQDPNKILIGS